MWYRCSCQGAYASVMTVDRDAEVACAALAEPGDLGWALATVLRAFVRAAELVLSDLPAGATRLADFQQRLRQVEQHVFQSLDEQEAVQLRLLLDRTAHGVRDADPTTCRHIAELTGTDGSRGQESPGC